MPGLQTDFADIGDQYETHAEAFLTAFAIPTRIPRARDYGADFYCVLKTQEGSKVVSTRDLFLLQVGGRGKSIGYGGMREGKPRHYEIEWLKSLTIPLLYGRVAADMTTIELFSMSPVWRVLLQSPAAFQIVCSLGEATDQVQKAVDPQRIYHPNTFGDCNRWEIDLGPPLLKATQTELRNPTFLASALELLKLCLDLYWQTVVRFQTRVAVSEFLSAWKTNSVEGVLLWQEMNWQAIAGENVGDLIRTLVPALMNLGATLQYANEQGAFSLIPLLDLCYQKGLLPPMGQGLLDLLRKAKNEKKGRLRFSARISERVTRG